MATTPIRVLVVDDHLVIRRGLATLLLAFNDMVLVGEAQTGAEALALCATLQPDVVLMDLLMPEMDGVEATRAIRERYPHIQVIVLTSCDEYDSKLGVASRTEAVALAVGRHLTIWSE